MGFANVRATGVAAASVTAALSSGRFARCYHGPAGSHATVSLHLDLTQTLTHASCGISDPSLTDLAACVTDASKHVAVASVPAGGASADVEVSFEMPQ